MTGTASWAIVSNVSAASNCPPTSPSSSSGAFRELALELQHHLVGMYEAKHKPELERLIPEEERTIAHSDESIAQRRRSEIKALMRSG